MTENRSLNISSDLNAARCSKKYTNRIMKYRRCERIKTVINTYIYRHGLPVAFGTTRNISTCGSFLETCYQPETIHQTVDIEFAINNDIYRLKAKVAHHCSEGLGLIFEDFNSSAKSPKLLYRTEIKQRLT